MAKVSDPPFVSLLNIKDMKKQISPVEIAATYIGIFVTLVFTVYLISIL
jgi:hypothetical protein